MASSQALSFAGGIRRRLDRGVLILPGLAILGFGFLVPLALLLPQSLQDPDFGFGAYARLFGESVYLNIVLNTARLAVIATVCCVIFGYPLALWISRLGPRMRIVALVALVLPFWVSILVRTYSWIVLLGREGVVNDILMRLGIIDEPLSLLYRELGVMIGTINILAPFFVMPMVAAMSAVDPRLTQAALSLGASRFQAFWRVFFPLTVPTLVTGAFLVFILTFGFYVTPAVIGGGRVKMLATLLDHLINTSSDWSLAAALSFFLLAATLGVVMLARALTALTRAGRRRAR